MKILVSGAGGFLGQHVVDRLVEVGHSVRAIVRPASQETLWPAGVEVFRADLRAATTLSSAFDGIDAVCHLAAAVTGNEDAQFASTVVATENFLTAMAQSSVKRLVHVSSLVVYDWSRAKRVMDEQTPLLASPYEMGGYTIAKTWQERIVSRLASAHSWKLTILRPGFIWGAGHAEIAGMGRKHGRAYLMFGPFAPLPLTHVANCADCIASVIDSPLAVGQIFNVVDGDEVRVWRYVREFSRRTGQKGVMVPIPYRVGLGVAYLALFTSQLLFGKTGKLPSLLTPRRYESQFKPIHFSDRKLREILNWKPRFDFKGALDLSYGR
jgi:nucleoside-diphosphate-sugar epimerase